MCQNLLDSRIYRHFCPEMLIRPSNKSCKSLFTKTQNNIFFSSSSRLCFMHAFISMILKTSLIQVLTYLSMLEKDKSIIKKLKNTRDYLSNSSKTRKCTLKMKMQGKLSHFCVLFLPPFFSFTFFFPFFLAYGQNGLRGKD